MSRRPGNGDTPVRRYRWTCPICGASNQGLVESHRAQTTARNNLVTHIRTTDGGGHGSAWSLPPDLDLADLDGYVKVRFEGR